MADLNNTIVRGKLRVTEDINTNGNIAGSSITGNGSGLTNLNASNISSGTLSADRHYSPTADSGSELTAKISGTAGAYAKDTEYTVLTGVKAQRDAKGHVTGLTYTAQKIKDTNTDTNTSHSHSAGVGLVGSGSAGTDGGTYDYKAKLRSETALTVDSAAATTTSGRVYPVAVDKSGYLSVNVPWTDTKNTAGATDYTGKLYLIGAGEQTDNPKTYSKSSLYVDEIGILTTSTLKTGTIKVNNLDLSIYGYNHDIATFKSYTNGETEEVLNGHLVIYGNDDSSNPLKPADKTGLTDLDTHYFNTGITLDSGGDAVDQAKLSFPAKSGTFLLDSDLVAEDMVEAVFSPSDKTYNSVPSGSLADSSNSILTVSSPGIEGSLNAGDRVAIKAFTGALGDNNTPICITNGGHLCPCTKYAGGTRVKLNGTFYEGQDASFYAPTAKGTSGYHLFWNGESTISPTANTYKNYTTTSSTKYYIAGWDSGTSTTSGNTPLKQMGQSIYMMGGSTGNLYASAFYAASDRRLKENIKDLDLNCLDLVNNINLREFSWKADETHKPVIGAIAQELRQVLPEKYVHEFIGGQETDDEYLSINDSKLVYLLIGAIQEQQKEIESLKAKIDSKIV